jgi:regulator of sirC expression with transglutaminase-like and TPR domain
MSRFETTQLSSPPASASSPITPSPVSAPLPPSRQQALLSLLSDDDASVRETVRAQIIAQGPACLGWIKRHALTNDPVLRRQIAGILDHFERVSADEDFRSFCAASGDEFDIEHAALLLARTEYPLVQIDGYRAWLDDLAGQLFERIDYSAQPDEIIGVINQYLFKELGFVGNEKDYYDPENSYLNRVLDRRTGNPINLSLVYLLLGRRLKLPLAGIGMPGHFVCRFQSTTAEFYVDVFNRGRLLTKGDCVKFLLQSNNGYHQSHLAPVTPRRMLIRICMNLHHIYLQRGDEARAERLQRYLLALSS